MTYFTFLEFSKKNQLKEVFIEPSLIIFFPHFILKQMMPERKKKNRNFTESYVGHDIYCKLCPIVFIYQMKHKVRQSPNVFLPLFHSPILNDNYILCLCLQYNTCTIFTNEGSHYKVLLLKLEKSYRYENYKLMCGIY